MPEAEVWSHTGIYFGTMPDEHLLRYHSISRFGYSVYRNASSIKNDNTYGGAIPYCKPSDDNKKGGRIFKCSFIPQVYILCLIAICDKKCSLNNNILKQTYGKYARTLRNQAKISHENMGGIQTAKDPAGDGIATATLRLIKANRLVSITAAFITTGTILADFLADEKKGVYSLKSHETYFKGDATRHSSKTLWVQTLSAHGYFDSYLHKVRHFITPGWINDNEESGNG